LGIIFALALARGPGLQQFYSAEIYPPQKVRKHLLMQMIGASHVWGGEKKTNRVSSESAGESLNWGAGGG